ncbi:MAG: VOC family protein [Betaproteobacteria bacterium]|nr:VOC family protein [Betaproteobacteria bacterium]
MTTQIYVNLPVKNLDKSKSFFTALGYSFNPQFTNEQGACMVVSDTIYVMLLVESFFQTFTRKQIADANKITEAIVCLSVETRAKVDEMVAIAVASGGAAPRKPEDHGFMYQHGFEDPDGHIWELVHLVASDVPNA